MAIIGDVIMSLREAATDLPNGVLVPPSTELSAAQSAATINTLPSGTYFVKLAYRTSTWGETLPSTELGGFVVDATHGITISAANINAIPAAATQIVAYFGIGAGNETQFVAFTPAQLPLTITAIGSSGSPRLRSTAFLPDSDGSAISAFAVYRWLNDGLKEAASKCGGGLPDLSGVASIAGQGIYTLTGNWWKCMKAWYDGYPMAVSGTDAIFRKNKVTGNYAMGFVVDHVDERVIIEIWPQPSRTSGASTLNGAITSGALNINLTSGATAFVLPFGLAQIGSEIIYYNTVTPTTMNIAIRGLGGTVAQAWPTGTAISELNIFFHGLRTCPIYNVGQAQQTLNVPPGWEPAIAHYLLHRFKLLEKDYKGSKEQYDFFASIIGALPANKPVGGPRQIQVGGSQALQTYPGLGGYGGGVIVP